MFKKILVPVDLSDAESTKLTVEGAAAVAKSSGAAVRLVTVLEPIPGYVAQQLPADIQKQAAAESTREAEAVAKNLPGATVAVRRGGVYQEILQEAEDWGADLIVMASHQPRATTYLLGSNAARVVRHAHCSVMVLRAPGM